MISTVDQSRTPLLDALVQAAQRPHRRFYTPGHKGGRGAAASLMGSLGFNTLALDIPEIPELDNLFAPESVIREAQTLAAAAFGADETYFLVNGSSCGLMAAILATCGPGDLILLPRTVHQSIVHGLILSGAHPLWLTPEYDPNLDIFHCLTPGQVSSALQQYPKVKAIAVVSPSYEGICGDIAGLAAIAHHHNIPLIVDEAHGPHFGLHPDLPPSALSQGADLVVQSTHKVLGALTQASMLHVRKNDVRKNDTQDNHAQDNHTQSDRINRVRLQSALRMVQSSSPNFLLLASLDAARHQIATQGDEIFAQAIAIATWAQAQIKDIANLRVLERSPHPAPPGYQTLDPLRLTVVLPPGESSGFALDHWLTEHAHVIAELPTARRLTFMLGIGNTPIDLENLIEALKAYCSSTSHSPAMNHPPDQWSAETYPPLVRSTYSPQQVFYQEAIAINTAQSVGAISHQTVCPYPPGIPVLFPGEVITVTAIQQLKQARDLGGQIIGAADPEMEQLWVLS